MTTNPTIPEPTSPTAAAVGKLNGQTTVAARLADFGRKWAVRYPGVGYGWRFWSELCDELTDIRVVDLAEVAEGINRLTDRVAELEACIWEREAAEPEPEPGADIPDEVIEAAWSAFDDSFGAMRAALAAADAKRAELEGEA